MRALGPVIPELGSVGASGDLTPMSYVAAVLSGEHEVSVAGRVCPAAEALAAAGLAPVAHAAELLERQLVLLCHSTPTSGIPENLIAVAGAGRTAHHGFKAIELLASALVAEAMKLAAPASVFSRSTEGHNQDKVPMGPIAARDLRAIGELADHLLAIALLAAAQATDATGRAAELPAPLVPHLDQLPTRRDQSQPRRASRSRAAAAASWSDRV